MKYKEYIGRNGEIIKMYSSTRKYEKNPNCGHKGKRIRVWEHKTRCAEYKREAYLISKIGIYKKRCHCAGSEFFVAPNPFIPKGGRYTQQVRDIAIDTLVQDRLNYIKTKERFKRDFLVSISVSTLFGWLNEAAGLVRLEDEFDLFVRDNFSGVLCIDEIYEKKVVVYIATDPLNDLRVGYTVVEKGDKGGRDRFLDYLKMKGIANPVVIITDDSPLYREVLVERFCGVEHQLCVFHIIQDIVDEVMKAFREIKADLPRPHPKPRGRPKKRTGRPCKIKSPHKFLWDNRHLIVKKGASFTKEDHTNLKAMYRLSPRLKLLRRFMSNVYRIFEKGISQQAARYRRTKLLKDMGYRHNPHLKKIMKTLLKEEKFERAIVSLKYENVDRTNNHVERTNRDFRMLQKTRYKRRTIQTIENALKLDWLSFMKKHPLYLFWKRKKAPPLPSSFYQHKEVA